MSSSAQPNLDFQYSIVICTPFPTHRLATYALSALGVDVELSPLVQRSFSLACPELIPGTAQGPDDFSGAERESSVLHTGYKATTNRMLRVAVNGFMESLSLVIELMAELDADVLA